MANSIKWSFLAEISAKLIQPVVFLVLASILSPDDFGVLNAALMVISFSQVVWDAGLAKALIQRQSDTEVSANICISSNLVLGVIIAILLIQFADLIAMTVFRDGRVGPVLEVMSLQIVLGAMSSVHSALLQKHFGFKKLFWVRFVSVSIPGLASVPLALYGFGYWALVIGSLVGQVVQVIILWHLSRWRPTISFDRKIAKELYEFGAWVSLSGLLIWFYAWADSLIIGVYLGSEALGLFRIGNQLVVMIFALLFGPVVPVFYSYCSRISSDSELIRLASEKILKILIFFSIPTSVTLYCFSDAIEDAVFGHEWTGVSLIIKTMALMHGISWIVGMNGELYRAVGRPSLETIITASTLAIYCVVYFVTVQEGFEVFLWARLALAVGTTVLHLIVLRKATSLSVRLVAKHLGVAVGCSITILPLSMIFSDLIQGAWPLVIVGGGVSMLVGLGFILLVTKREVVGDIKSLLGVK